MITPEDLLAPQDAGFRDRTITLRTLLYCPPFRVTIRADVTGWGNQDIDGVYDTTTRQWRFTLPAATFSGAFRMKFVLDTTFWMIGDDISVAMNEATLNFKEAQIQFAYELQFKTNRWKPSQLITLRNSDDGWGQDIYGVFRVDHWQFLLDRASYSASLEAKLVLERSIFMNGANLRIQSSSPFVLVDDAQVTFNSTPSAYQHGYDNFLPLETPQEQLIVMSMGREDTHYDVIVIGSGMGGGALANALSDRGAKVLVLDAGSLRYPVHINDLPRTEIDVVGRDQLGHFHNIGPSDLAQGVQFNLGGRSVYWSGVIPRMNDWELRSVWPASVRNFLLNGADGLMTGYERAEKQMRKQKTLGPFQDRVRNYLQSQLSPDYGVYDLPRALHQPDVDDAGRLANVVQRSTGNYSTADLLLDSLGVSGQLGRGNLKVNLEHLCLRIETYGSQATAVICQDLAGKAQRRFHGKYIVMACGSIESAKLALNSGLADPNGKIGIGLTDHPEYFYTIHHELPTSGILGWLGDPLGHAKLQIRPNAADGDQHAYNIEVLINAKFWDARHADDNLWTSMANNGEPSRVEIKFLFDSPLRDDNKVVAHGEGKKVDVYIDANPPIHDYKQEVVDVRNAVLGALGVTGLSTAWNHSEWSEGIFGTVHHAGGTLRMSGDGTGVVDENLKFLAYDNLYCSDVSVYPSIPAANPSLTLTALALRLSDELSMQLGLP
jgi:choline dehydrogenase-like flavoprotein